MIGYAVISLDTLLSKEKLDLIEEDIVKNTLSSFSCLLNLDIEDFLHQKAVLFSKQGIAKTHLVMASYKGKPELAGYFALANKSFVVKAESKAISNTLKKRIARYGIYDKNLKQYTITAPLIGQIGKNDNFPTLIAGRDLLYLACSEVKKAQNIVGGKIVYLECEYIPKLKDFYSKNGFIEFGRRELDSDETALKTKYLIQMLKHL